MAKNKNVRTLYHLSLIQVCNLIVCTTQVICKRNGPNFSPKLKKQLQFVQRYILTHIHPHFLDEIVNTFDKLSSFQWLFSDKIKSSLVAVCMHPKMKVFKPRFQLPINDDMYMFYLRNMNHLRSLNLSMVCSDEILEVVGKSCPLLEFIDITSKVESATNSAIRFNALKLRFFVSDRGLQYLHQCKRLKKVVMNSIIRSNCGGGKISNVGIKNLVLHLNMLKFINYQDMGLVLDELSSSERQHSLLNLIHLQDNHVSLQHIDLFALLCPKLRSLTLCVPQNNLIEGLSATCLERLSNNCMTLSCLDLWFFSFDVAMINFLILKGKHLTSLSLKDCGGVDTKGLINICAHCPNLKFLKINLLNNSDNEIYVPKECSFKFLEELYLAGTCWDPYIVFNMCIMPSLGIRIVSLSNKSFLYKLDSEIKALMMRNPLTDLTEIAFLEGCKISFTVLKDFLLYCSNLGRLTVFDDNTESLSEQLICFISVNPFDINIDIKIERSR